MRIVFWLVGMLALAEGGLFFVVRGQPYWDRRLAGTTLVFAGLSCCVASIAKYRGHWSFILGLLFLSGAAHVFGLVLDGVLRSEPSYIFSPTSYELFIAELMSLFGVLSLVSAQRLHRVTLEREVGHQLSDSSGSADLRPLFWLFSVLLLVLQLCVFRPPHRYDGALWLSWMRFAVPLCLTSLLFCVAAIRSYRGYYSFIVGLCLLYIGGEYALLGVQRHYWIAVSSFGCGLLSLWSGHKLHRYTLERDGTQMPAVPTQHCPSHTA
jgi:hypothetical protein